nr:30S ribosomal protein S6 [Bacillota bacterium]
RTAYELKRFHEAYYIVMRFFGDSSAKDEIDRQLKLTDEVLRHLFVRLEDEEKASEEEFDESVVEEASD